MTEKGKRKGREKKRTGKAISSFAVLAIVISVLVASVVTVSAVDDGIPGEPWVTGIEVTAYPTSIPLLETSTITATVTWDNQPDGSGFPIHFEILDPDLGAVIDPNVNTTNASGVATTTLTAGAEETGTVTVRAWWYGNETYSKENTTTVMITPTEDTTPPAAITDLATSNPTTSSIDLTWTARGDDEDTGTATTYDIRYSTSAITDANWDSAEQCTGEPAPQTAGSSEAFMVTGLAADTTYYFAIKTADEVPNWSPISNSQSGTTLVSEDTTPPAAVTGLAASNPTSSTIDLTWTAPGDDEDTGTATTYDIRYSTLVITDANWDSAEQCTGEPAPQVAGSSEAFTVTGLLSSTTYYFALKTEDEVPNESPLSNVESETTLAPSQAVVINEYIPDPEGDDNAPMPDGEWVELYNLGDAEVNVSGWVLYDSVDANELYITPENTNTGDTIVPANGWLVVYRDGDGDFSLNQDADEVRLYDGYPVADSNLIDETSYASSTTGKSWARIPDGTGEWQEADPTPGETNGAAPVLTTITVSPPSITLKVNDTRQFIATAYDQDGIEMSGVTFAWAVSNGTVGTVNATGFFEAKALGSTLVNATAEGVTGSAEVTVTEWLWIGDMNGDGNVTFDDAVYLARYVLAGDMGPELYPLYP